MAIERFKNWFNRHGHWMYDTKSDALDQWVRTGINSLPRAPENAKHLLRDWL